jgi:multiple sugar transport system ATP-binding protein
VSARQTGHVFVARFSLHSTAAAHVPIRGKRHRTVALPSSRGHAAGLSAIRVTRGRALAKIGFRSIRKSFGDTAVLHDVSLDIGDGEFMTFVGPSGCGKTTLLRILAGLEVQDSGEVRLGERVVDRLPPKQRDIAMVFQSYALYPYMTVAENIALPLTMRRLSAWQRLPLLGRFIGTADSIRRGIDADVTQTAMALGLERLLSRRPGQLSGGQRQRVALGRAMVRHPSAFLMDEPLSNLDAKLRVQARTEISELHRRIGGTFVYVTHDQVEAMTMSDRVAVMIDGRLLQVAAPQRLYAEPDDLRVAEFIGSPRINTLDGIVDESGRVVVLGQALPVKKTIQRDFSLRSRPAGLPRSPFRQRRDAPPEHGLDLRLEPVGCEWRVRRGRAPDLVDGLGRETTIEQGSIGNAARLTFRAEGQVAFLRGQDPGRGAAEVAAMAGPGVVAGIGDDPGADGVQLDVAIAGKHICFAASDA